MGYLTHPAGGTCPGLNVTEHPVDCANPKGILNEINKKDKIKLITKNLFIVSYPPQKAKTIRFLPPP